MHNVRQALEYAIWYKMFNRECAGQSSIEGLVVKCLMDLTMAWRKLASLTSSASKSTMVYFVMPMLLAR